MSVMDKFLSAMKLNGDDESGYYDQDDDAYYDSPIEPIHKASSLGKDDPSIEINEERLTKKPVAAPRPVPSRNRGVGGMEVCVVKPTSIEDAREITETLLNNRTVVLNLEGIDVELAQRIIDFTSGSCFAINGNLQKISRYIFIVTPASVDISGDFQDILGGAYEGSLGSIGPQQM
ncbi:MULTISPECIES: cell division protein SepF [unclassified Butyrivibrio]|uniref:cell division protein SepF n=1 Tax=unclassified Butyrivibrio TaxID=2639466 RepID=UPI0003B6EA87|nr:MULTISPECIES: cell division protein SepF [unclassified Butyrivibrio]